VRIQKEKRKKVSQGEKTILARRPALGKKNLGSQNNLMEATLALQTTG